MIARLDDPWFEAQFTRNTTRLGLTFSDGFVGSDGLWLWCPCGYGKPEYPLDGGRPHAILVSFANPFGCAPAPADAGSQSRTGGPSRWVVSGDSLKNLTVQPSVDVGTPSCWHGWIQNGVVT